MLLLFFGPFHAKGCAISPPGVSFRPAAPGITLFMPIATEVSLRCLYFPFDVYVDNRHVCRNRVYLLSFHTQPSLVSFTSNPASFRASRIWSHVAQSLLARALARSSRIISITLP